MATFGVVSLGTQPQFYGFRESVTEYQSLREASLGGRDLRREKGVWKSEVSRAALPRRANTE